MFLIWSYCDFTAWTHLCVSAFLDKQIHVKTKSVYHANFRILEKMFSTP